MFMDMYGVGVGMVECLRTWWSAGGHRWWRWGCDGDGVLKDMYVGGDWWSRGGVAVEW